MSGARGWREILGRCAAMAGLRFRAVGAVAVLAVVLAVMLGGVGPAAIAREAGRVGSRTGRADEDFQGSWRLAAGKTIEIKGVNGDIDAAVADGVEVEVTARKHARRSDPREVKIEVIEHLGGVTICAVYPGRWGQRNECTPGERSHVHVDNNDVVVDFRVRVPAGIRFVGRTVNGEIDAVGLKGPAEAHTVNG